MKKWFQSLKQGLTKTSTHLGEGLKQVFVQKKLAPENLQDLEDALIQADLGPTVSRSIIEKLRTARFDKDDEMAGALNLMAQEIEKALKPYEKTLTPEKGRVPFAILMAGVNGTGKTTTTAKLAHLFQDQGYKISMAACDTFRAAAVEQLVSWGNKLNIPVVSKPHGADAAGLAYEAYEKAQINKDDIVFFDTAGRLHTNTNLMEELSKITRVLQKINPNLPHESILVIDGTTGQNAYRQVEVYQQSINITGLIVTKLDGTAKGGMIVGLCERFKLPLYALGVGEKITDLQPFNAHNFARALVGLGDDDRL
ncbi:MAG: signal recognition particle-docking protein FtsY [Alphaproteobacteria bacterium]